MKLTKKRFCNRAVLNVILQYYQSVCDKAGKLITSKNKEEHVTMILISEWVQKRHLIMQKSTTGLINGVAEQIIMDKEVGFNAGYSL